MLPKRSSGKRRSEALIMVNRKQFNLEFKDPNLKLSQFLTALFEQMDRDNDGTVTWQEFTQFLLELQGVSYIQSLEHSAYLSSETKSGHEHHLSLRSMELPFIDTNDCQSIKARI